MFSSPYDEDNHKGEGRGVKQMFVKNEYTTKQPRAYTRKCCALMIVCSEEGITVIGSIKTTSIVDKVIIREQYSLVSGY